MSITSAECVYASVCEHVSHKMPFPKWEQLFKAWFEYHCDRDVRKLQDTLRRVAVSLGQSFEEIRYNAGQLHICATSFLKNLHDFYQITHDFEQVLSCADAVRNAVRGSDVLRFHQGGWSEHDLLVD